ncbi:hypothetical protein Tco_0385274 [Tanacetum coccineum]
MRSSSSFLIPDDTIKIRVRGAQILGQINRFGLLLWFLNLELRSDTTKVWFTNLNEENKALKMMNKMPVGVMDGTSGVVSNNSFGKGKGKVPVPPFGSPERPRPDVTPRIAESFKSRPCHPELIRMYGYQSTDEYYADYDYWNTWVQDESTDEEDEDEVMTTKDDDLLFYQDTFPVDKFVPFGKGGGGGDFGINKRIGEKPYNTCSCVGSLQYLDMG